MQDVELSSSLISLLNEHHRDEVRQCESRHAEMEAHQAELQAHCSVLSERALEAKAEYESLAEANSRMLAQEGWAKEDLREAVVQCMGMRRTLARRSGITWVMACQLEEFRSELRHSEQLLSRDYEQL